MAADPLQSLPSGAHAPVRRHPLGLPAGSVRALLTLIILGILWTLMLLPPERTPGAIPLYLYYLMFVALVHFFAAHGNTIATAAAPEPSPWYLPGGTIRLLIILGFLGVIGWRIYTQRDPSDLVPTMAGQPPVLPFVLVLAFFLGVFITRVVLGWFGSPSGPPYWYQDIQAWVAILAMLGLGAEVIIQTVINPSLPEESRLWLPEWQALLAAIVGFYFGARS